MATLTAERLRTLFHYDPGTGVFTRLLLRGGQPAGPVTPRPDKVGRCSIKVDGKSQKLHRLAWLYVYGRFPETDIDHADNNPNNNAIVNLRPATRSQNAANARRFATNSTGAKGTSEVRGRYRARIMHQGSSVHIGYFDTPDAAGAAYAATAAKLFGEFARSA